MIQYVRIKRQKNKHYGKGQYENVSNALQGCIMYRSKFWQWQKNMINRDDFLNVSNVVREK